MMAKLVLYKLSVSYTICGGAPHHCSHNTHTSVGKPFLRLNAIEARWSKSRDCPLGVWYMRRVGNMKRRKKTDPRRAYLASLVRESDGHSWTASASENYTFRIQLDALKSRHKRHIGACTWQDRLAPAACILRTDIYSNHFGTQHA